MGFRHRGCAHHDRQDAGGEPDWQALPATTPPNIGFVLRRCVEKSINSRFQCVGDLRILMEESHSLFNPHYS
jgi:hypothetical protein